MNVYLTPRSIVMYNVTYIKVGFIMHASCKFWTMIIIVIMTTLILIIHEFGYIWFPSLAFILRSDNKSQFIIVVRHTNEPSLFSEETGPARTQLPCSSVLLNSLSSSPEYIIVSVFIMCAS